MSTARSTPIRSRSLRNALGERQYSATWSKSLRDFFISASASGLNSSIGWMWTWESVIISIRARQHCSFGKDPHHFAAVFRREDRSRQRLGRARCEVGDVLRNFLAGNCSYKLSIRILHQKRRRIDGGNGDAHIFHKA